MIEIKAESDAIKKGTAVSSHIEGTLEEILNEALAIIDSLIGNIKKQSVLGHATLLQALADNPEIFMGESEEGDKHEKFAKMMAEMTSKGMFGKGDLN